jgi:hypothetical protein
MPYTIMLDSNLDFGGFIGIGAELSGTSTTPTPATDTATATATDTSPRVLDFMSATPPPPGAATLHVTNTVPEGTGDLFRSGELAGLPPGTPGAPATLKPFTVPTVFAGTPTTIISDTKLASELSKSLPIVLTPPAWVVAAVTAASLGTHIPLTVLHHPDLLHLHRHHHVHRNHRPEAGAVGRRQEAGPDPQRARHGLLAIRHDSWALPHPRRDGIFLSLLSRGFLNAPAATAGPTSA